MIVLYLNLLAINALFLQNLLYWRLRKIPGDRSITKKCTVLSFLRQLCKKMFWFHIALRRQNWLCQPLLDFEYKALFETKYPFSCLSSSLLNKGWDGKFSTQYSFCKCLFNLKLSFIGSCKKTNIETRAMNSKLGPKS